jgi:hypothetical protein
MQIFPRSMNRLPIVAGLAAALALPGVVAFVWYYFSPWYTHVGYQPKQPVPYSHRFHVGQLGIDCRYCHVNVERSAVAMVPPTQTCMNCHSVIKTESARLAPIRESWKTGQAMEWVRVHKLPDFAYFDHSAHVGAKDKGVGVGCVEFLGRIDQMEVVRMVKPLSMGWCLECHRDVKANQGDSQFIRPISEITNMGWQKQGKTDPLKPLNPPEHCSGCHR